jgi:tetratricopeptide (TPR) repeat protein
MRKHFAAVSQDPKAVPDAQFVSIINDYRRLIQRFPKSRYVPQMYSEIGSLYLLNKKYEDARKTYGEVVAKFSGHDDVVSKAMVDIGNSYLIEEKFDQAIQVFQQVWDGYSRTEVGLMMPLYIAGLYRNANRLDGVQNYLNKAVVFYKSIADNTAEPDVLRINAHQTLATTYMAQEKWGSALDVLRKMLYDFADSNLITPQRLRMISRMINVIAVTRLKNHDKAIEIYQDFIKDHPGHFLNQFLEKVVESLNYLKANQGQAAFSQQ